MIKTISLFLKNIGFNMVADLSNKLVNSILILMLSSFLGVVAMGAYSVAHTFFSFGLMFSYWGFGNLMTREIARNRDSYNKYLINFGVMRIVLAIISIVGINLLVGSLNYAEQTQSAVRIISIGIIANTLINLIFAVFIAFEELKYMSAISLTISILRLVIFYIVLKQGGSVATIALFYTVTEFISLMISMSFAKSYVKDLNFKLDFKFCAEQIIKAFPFFWIAVLVVLDSRVEILIISLFLSEAAVGYYTAMITIIGGLALFSEGIRNAVFPIFARYQINDPGNLEKMVLLLGKYILLVTIPIAFSVFSLANEIITLFFRSGYDISADLLQIVVWSFVSYSLTVISIRLLMVLDRERLVVISLFVSGILTIILNILLVPKFGLIGVAIVRLITSYVLFFLCLGYLHRLGYRIIDFSIFLRIVLASVILFLSAFLLQLINAYLGLIMGLLIYLGFIWFVDIINLKEIQMWKDVFRNLFNFTSAK